MDRSIFLRAGVLILTGFAGSAAIALQLESNSVPSVLQPRADFACAAGSVCLMPAQAQPLQHLAGTSYVTVQSQGPSEAAKAASRLLVVTNTSALTVRVRGFGQTAETTLLSRQGMAVPCESQRPLVGTVDVLGGNQWTGLPVSAGCGDSVNVH